MSLGHTGREVCWSVKTTGVGMLVSQMAGVGREVCCLIKTAGVDKQICWLVKWLG